MVYWMNLTGDAPYTDALRTTEPEMEHLLSRLKYVSLPVQRIYIGITCFDDDPNLSFDFQS